MKLFSKNFIDFMSMILFSGGLMCCLSSIEGLKPVLPEDEKYARYLLALIGQGITGIACPFISCVPTKISQHW